VANLRSFKILIGKSKPWGYGYLAMYASQRMPALLMPGRKKAGGVITPSGSFLPPYLRQE